MSGVYTVSRTKNNLELRLSCHSLLRCYCHWQLQLVGEVEQGVAGAQNLVLSIQIETDEVL